MLQKTHFRRVFSILFKKTNTIRIFTKFLNSMLEFTCVNLVSSFKRLSFNFSGTQQLISTLSFSVMDILAIGLDTVLVSDDQWATVNPIKVHTLHLFDCYCHQSSAP